MASTRKIKYAPTAHVRNQYESVNGTGRQQIHVEQYNVNATGNNTMPGYTMHSRRFRPHSKSTLQRVTKEAAVMKRQKMSELAGLIPPEEHQLNHADLETFNLGWGPAVSAENASYVAPNLAASRQNQALMRNTFGNAWVNAEVSREAAEAERRRIMSNAVHEVRAQLGKMESDFRAKYKLEPPSRLSRIRTRDLEAIDARFTAGTISDAEYNQARAQIMRNYGFWIAKIGPKISSEYIQAYNKLQLEFDKKIVNSEARSNKAARNILAASRKGTPYVPRVRKTLANRLRNAKAVRNSFV